jgi:ornithine carbamoyltransferase
LVAINPLGSPPSAGLGWRRWHKNKCPGSPPPGEIEVSNSVIDGPHSIVYQEAENRLHVQKAVMALTM